MQENNMNYPKFKVCVRCFTFNQSKYITDAMNGFTMQQTSFPFVCTIVDDASTDGEQDVIRKYVEDNFDFSEGSVAFHKETDYAHITYAQHKTNKNCFFAVLYLKENHYSQRKPKMGYLSEWRDMCEYEAICEGDDYWIHPKKLQMQVDFLEKNDDYGLVYGKAKQYIQKSNKFGKNIGIKKNGFEDLLLENGICTLTTMYRISAIKGYDEFVAEERKRANWMMGDYQIWLYISYKYKVFFFDEILAVYRYLENSASHSTSYEREKQFKNSVFSVKYFFAEKYCLNSNEWKSKLCELQNHAFYNLAIVHNKKEDAKKYFSKITKPTIKEWIKYICFVILPFGYVGKY